MMGIVMLVVGVLLMVGPNFAPQIGKPTQFVCGIVGLALFLVGMS